MAPAKPRWLSWCPGSPFTTLACQFVPPPPLSWRQPGGPESLLPPRTLLPELHNQSCSSDPVAQPGAAAR
jgi:hypothetical protein